MSFSITDDHKNTNQEDLFDILDGTDDFPFLNKVTKESFSANLSTLILSENEAVDKNDPATVKLREKKVVDDFNVDEFLYKNFRFVLLNDLNNELSKLNNDLDDELLNLVNNDYHDFIKLGQSINNDNFLNLVSSIKISIVNYFKNLKSQQSNFEKDFNTVNDAIFFKKKIFKLTSFLEKAHLLFKLIDSFEKLINEHSNIERDIQKQEKNKNLMELDSEDDNYGTDDDSDSDNIGKVDILDAVLENDNGDGINNVLTIEVIKELTSLYLSIHQLQQYLTSRLSQNSLTTAKDNNKNQYLDTQFSENRFLANDITQNIKQLNALTIHDLLDNNSEDNFNQAHSTNSNNNNNNEYHRIGEVQQSIGNKFLDEQLKRVNKLRLEFKSILDEYLRKIADASIVATTIANTNTLPTTNNSVSASSTDIHGLVRNTPSDLKEAFARLKLQEQVEKSYDNSATTNKAELLELLGIYLMLGDEENFLKIMKHSNLSKKS